MNFSDSGSPSFGDLRRRYQERPQSVAETTRELFRTIAQRDDGLGVFLQTFEGQASQAAADADVRLADRGLDDSQPLCGMPLGVKDVIATREAPTTGQSLVHELSIPAGRDAVVIGRLRAAGGIVIGKTTTSEFAFGHPDPTKPFPIPRNPWDQARWPGGSSAGSASGVASGLLAGAVSTDTAGSTRVPAAFCGVTGLVPTHGVISTSGVMPLASSMDRVGFIAHSARDCFDMVQCAIPGDQPNSALEDLESLRRKLARPVRIGVVTDRPLLDEEDPAVDRRFQVAIDTLAELGCAIAPINLPDVSATESAAAATIACEAFAVYGTLLATRWLDFYKSTRLRMSLGALVSGPDYVIAQAIRRRTRRKLESVFDDVDLVASPTIGMAAPLYGQDGTVSDFDMVTRLAYTSYWSAVGCPAISIPMGFNRDGLPLGLQLVGWLDADRVVTGVASAYQDATDWHLQTPTGVESLKHA